MTKLKNYAIKRNRCRVCDTIFTTEDSEEICDVCLAPVEEVLEDFKYIDENDDKIEGWIKW